MNMEKLKLINHYYGTYMQFKYTIESTNRLYHSIEDLKLVDPDARWKSKEDYHTTFLYTREPHPNLKFHQREIKFKVEPVELSLFGDNMDILVLEVFNDDLIKYHEELIRENKILEDYPQYRPHITLAKNFTASLEDVYIEIPLILVTKELLVEPLEK